MGTCEHKEEYENDIDKNEKKIMGRKFNGAVAAKEDKTCYGKIIGENEHETVIKASGDKYELLIFPSLNAVRKNKDILASFSADSYGIMSLNFEETEREFIYMNMMNNIYLSPKKISEVIFNPFCYIHSNGDVIKLSNLLLSPFRPFYTDDIYGHEESGRRFNTFLNALIAFLLHCCSREMQNAENIIKLCKAFSLDENDSMTKTALDLVFEGEEESNPESFAVKQYKSFKLNSPEIQRYIAASVASFLSEYDFVKMESLNCISDAILGKKKENFGRNKNKKVWLDTFIRGEVLGISVRMSEEGEEIVKEKRVLIVDIDNDIAPCTNATFWYYLKEMLDSNYKIY